MKFTVLKRLTGTLSSTCRLKLSCHQRWLSLLQGQGLEHLQCPLTLSSCHRAYHGIISHSLLTNLTLSISTRNSIFKIPESSCSTQSHWRGISTNIRKVFTDKDDDVDEDDDDNDDHETRTDFRNKSRDLLGSKTLTEFKERCKNLEMKMRPEDWQDLKQQVLMENPYAEKSWELTCMRLLYAARNMELAESFTNYIRGTDSPPKMSTLATFIALCGRTCGKHKQELIFEAYDEILKISDLFDSSTIRYLIQGFSHTDRWRECLDFIEMTKLADCPTTIYYSPVVCAALREEDIDLALSLVKQMGDEGMRPLESVFQEFVKKLQDSQSGISLNMFMDMLKKYHWLMSEETALLLEKYFKGSEDRKYKNKFSRVKKGGVCQACKHRLKRLELSDAEFEILQREMLENVLMGDNVYLHSSPDEVERFKDFVQENAPFDVVLDALNVAYRSTSGASVRKPNSLFLKKVVAHFAHFQHQRVLVIGRKHMKTWPPQDMQYIEGVAKTFYTDNNSKDDPFSLYAAIYSGKSCLIVSHDHMKDHKFKLGAHMKEAFEQWQRSHQITSCYFDRGRMYVELPARHETGPQEDAKGWHIPYEDQSERPVYQRPDTWLCVRDMGGKSRKKTV